MTRYDFQDARRVILISVRTYFKNFLVDMYCELREILIIYDFL